MHRLLANRAGFVLGMLHFSFLPLPALGSIPHLAPQLLCSIQ